MEIQESQSQQSQVESGDDPNRLYAVELYNASVFDGVRYEVGDIVALDHKTANKFVLGHIVGFADEYRMQGVVIIQRIRIGRKVLLPGDMVVMMPSMAYRLGRKGIVEVVGWVDELLDSGEYVLDDQSYNGGNSDEQQEAGKGD